MSRAAQSSTCVDAEPFALRVTDDSMEPEFPSGCVVVVDPTGTVEDGAYVIAAAGAELTFRKLRVEGEQLWLEALRAGYPPLTPDEGIASVKGVVVQRAGTRRREHKRYD